MSSLSDYIDIEELREIVRLHAHRLLIGYEETQEEEFWLLSEKLADLYEYLLTSLPSKTKIQEKKFPEDYWLLCQEESLLNTELK